MVDRFPFPSKWLVHNRGTTVRLNITHWLGYISLLCGRHFCVHGCLSSSAGWEVATFLLTFRHPTYANSGRFPLNTVATVKLAIGRMASVFVTSSTLFLFSLTGCGSRNWKPPPHECSALKRTMMGWRLLFATAVVVLAPVFEQYGRCLAQANFLPSWNESFVVDISLFDTTKSRLRQSFRSNKLLMSFVFVKCIHYFVLRPWHLKFIFFSCMCSNCLKERKTKNKKSKRINLRSLRPIRNLAESLNKNTHYSFPSRMVNTKA